MTKDDYDPQLNLEQSAVDLLDNKAKLSLYKKSSESGIPINVLEEVFMRGYASWDGNFSRNPIQVAFNRVNSFIAGGFASQLDEDLKQSCWTGYEAIGTKKKNGKTVPNCVPVKEAVVAPPVQVSQPAAPAPTQIARPAPQRAQLNQAGNQFRASSQVSPTQRTVRSGSTQARTSMGGQGGYSSASQQLKPTSQSVRTPASYSASRSVPTPSSRMAPSGGGSMKPTSVGSSSSGVSQTGVNMTNKMAASDKTNLMARKMAQGFVPNAERSVGQSVAGRLGAAAGRVAGAMSGPAGVAVGAAAPILADKMKGSYRSAHNGSFKPHDNSGENVSTVFNRMRNSQAAQGRSAADYEKEVLTPKNYEKPAAQAPAPETKQMVDAPAPPSRPKYMTRGQAFQAANKEAGDNAQFTYGDKVYQANRKGKQYVVPSKQVPTSVREDIEEATYQGREVKLNTPMKGDVKKSKVFVKDPSTGNVKKVNYGDKNMSIKKDQPERKKSYCARSGGLGNTGDKTSANYWSRKAWNCSEEATDLDEKLNLKKAAQVAGVAASLAYDAHHLHKNPHDVGYAAPAAVSYLAPGAKVAGSMIPAALKVDRANAGEDEKARQKKYSKLKEESKLLNKPTPSPAEIAKKFDTSVSKVNKSIEQGTKVEREHTKSNKLAKEIATDHLGERPDYYKKLANLEKSPVKEEDLPLTKRRLADGTPERTDWLKNSTPGQTTTIVKRTIKEALKDV